MRTFDTAVGRELARVRRADGWKRRQVESGLGWPPARSNDSSAVGSRSRVNTRDAPRRLRRWRRVAHHGGTSRGLAASVGGSGGSARRIE